MVGLLYKEFYTLKRYIRSYSVVFIVFLLASISMKSPIYLQSMLAMCLGMLVLTGMSYDKSYGWDRMVQTLPVKRESIVLSKYVTSVLLNVFSLVFSTAVGTIVSIFIPMGEDVFKEMLFMAATLLSLLMFGYAIIFPIIYKFGVERARIVMAAVFIIPVLFVMNLLEDVPMDLLGWIEEHIVLSGMIFFILSLISYIVSYCLSVKIYKNKEF